MRDGLKNQKILTLTAIAAAFLLFLIPLSQSMRSLSDSEETAEGKAYIETEANKDAVEITKKITQAGEENTADTGQMPAEETPVPETPQEETTVPQIDITALQEQINTLNITQLTAEEIASYDQRLMNTQIVGDSMTQAVYDYGLMDADHVWFVRGASIGTLGEQIQSAINMIPENIVFFTGANAVDYYATAQEFAEAYKNQCSNVLSQRPDMRIYICSLPPVSDELAAYREDLAKTGEYDAALKAMCEENGINYIDLNWMVRQELYIEDGIHFNRDFYQIWLQYITLCLGV